MPATTQYAHRVISQTNLPYVTNKNIIDTDPCFFTGSTDLLTNVNGYCRRRPGFSDKVETVATTFYNLKRIFTFERNDGSIYLITSDINSSGNAVVYKMLSGVDASFTSIFTSSDTTSTPFDFVASNNTLYFGNGQVMKKWDPVNGVSNWGISIGSFGSAAGPNGVATAADVNLSGNVWTNVANITAADGSYATVTLGTNGGSFSPTDNCGSGADVGGGSSSWTNPGNVAVSGQSTTNTVLANGGASNGLNVTNFGFSIPSGATINGITATFDSTGSGLVGDDGIFLLGSGTTSDHSLASSWSVVTSRSYGSSTDLWGTTWTPSQINSSSFGIQISAINNSASNKTAKVNAFVTITVYYTVPASGSVYSDYLQGTNCSFNVATANSIQGILVEVKGLQSVANANTSVQLQLLKGGNLVGSVKSSNLGLSNGYVSFGGNSDLWGTTWTPSDVNGSSFGASLVAFTSSGTVTWSIDFIRITVYSAGAPAVTTTTGTLTASTGFQYVITYGNSGTGHVSSPSLPSSVIKPSAQGVQISLTASSDAQVNQIHVYRTTDSATGLGGQSYFEIPTSPYPNTTQNVTDNAADTALNIYSIAPTPTFNDPPPASQGFVYFAGRLWMFVGNKVWFTGLEEIINGVPEESVPSGVAGNFWSFDQPVQGLGTAGIGDGQVLLVFCGGRVYQISGNTLDTFRRKQISNRRGCRNRAAIAMMGGMCAWLDSANQVWATDGNTLQEASIDIRPDLVNLTQSNCSLTFHTNNNFHWLVLSTGAKLYIYDIDTEQWMPPWSFACQYIYSGETSPGRYKLMAATSTTALQMSDIDSNPKFNDNGTSYQPVIQTNLFSVIPDFGKRFSYIATGIYNEPSRTGVPKIFSITNNGKDFADVAFVADDDPSQATFTSIKAQETKPEVAFVRRNGVNLSQRVYAMNQPLCRWIAFKTTLQNNDQDDRIYEMWLAYEEYR